jgi:hypothetical protein
MALRVIKGVIGAPEQIFTIGNELLAERNKGESKADGHGESAGVGFNRFAGHREAQTLRQFGESGGVATRDDDEKFFAAVAACAIVTTNDKGETAGDLEQDFVADEMAIGIVDEFEVIDIGHDETEGIFVAAAALEFGDQAVNDGAAIAEVGETVMPGFEA